jgi:hypothetical protein
MAGEQYRHDVGNPHEPVTGRPRRSAMQQY